MAPGSLHSSTEPGEDDACSYGGKASIIPKSLCVQEKPCSPAVPGEPELCCATQDVSWRTGLLPTFPWCWDTLRSASLFLGVAPHLTSVRPTATVLGLERAGEKSKQLWAG